jgi:hypothetical protein
MPAPNYCRHAVPVTTDEDTGNGHTYFSAGVSLGPNDTIISFRGPVHAHGQDATVDHDGMITLRYFRDTEYLWDRAGITVKNVDPLTGYTEIHDYIFQITLIDQNGWHL